MQQSTIVRSTRTSRIGTIAAVLLVGLLTSVPWWSSPASMRLITEFLVYLALASMWNLLAGYAGLLSIGQHAYVGFGGYAMFSCALFLGIGPLYAIPIAGAAAALKRAARGPVKIGWWGSSLPGQAGRSRVGTAWKASPSFGPASAPRWSPCARSAPRIGSRNWLSRPSPLIGSKWPAWTIASPAFSWSPPRISPSAWSDARWER